MVDRSPPSRAPALIALSAAVSIAFVPGADHRPPVVPSAHAEGPAVYLPLALRGGAPVRAALDRARVFGMQISEVRFRDPKVISDVHAAGATFWRTFVFWDEVEPERARPPAYSWHLYDPLFQTASRLGLVVIAEVQGNPAWAADLPGGPPRDLDTLAQFMAAAVERYDGDGVADAPGSPIVRYWELYNEPDNTDFALAREGRGWGAWGRSGAEYARMLKRVYPVVKLASPGAQVLFGGVAHDNFLEESGPFNAAFVDDVLAAGAGPYFDIMNFHYYPLYAPRWAPFGPGPIGKAAAIRRKLAAHGVVKPMMITEAGTWSAAGPPYPSATPADQARYVPQVYAQALAADVETLIWFHYDDVAGFDDPARGLVDRDLAPKPALVAYRVASEVLAGASPMRPARDQAAPGEVYWFRRDDERVAVAWTHDGATASLAVRAPSVEWIQTLGRRHTVRDAADGRADGVTRVPYGPDPVFVRVPAAP